MKWFHPIIAGVVLIAVGLFMRKAVNDSAANARAGKAAKAADNEPEPAEHA